MERPSFLVRLIINEANNLPRSEVLTFTWSLLTLTFLSLGLCCNGFVHSCLCDLDLNLWAFVFWLWVSEIFILHHLLDLNHLDFDFRDQLVFLTNMLILKLISQWTILDLTLKVWSWACGNEFDLAGTGLQHRLLYLHFNVSNKQQIWTEVSLSLCRIRLQ